MDELAKAIVHAADLLEHQSGSRPMTIATIRVGKFRLINGDIEYPYLLKMDSNNYLYVHIENGINDVWRAGYVRMNETEEQRWKDMITEMDCNVPEDIDSVLPTGKLLMVFWKPLKEEGTGSCEQGKPVMAEGEQEEEDGGRFKWMRWGFWW